MVLKFSKWMKVKLYFFIECNLLNVYSIYSSIFLVIIDKEKYRFINCKYVDQISLMNILNKILSKK